MAKAQFLVRNRHQNIWYARVVIPSSIRPLFQGDVPYLTGPDRKR